VSFIRSKKEIHVKFFGQILSEGEQEKIHEQSLRILAEVGVRFHGVKALRILESNGAQVDWDNKIARFSPEMVSGALAMTPRSILLGARNPAFNFQLPAQVSRYAMDGTASFATDFATGERRYGLKKDIENGLRVFQEMDMGVLAWAPTTASDVPAQARALHEFFAMIQFCSKHGQHELHRVEQVPYLVEGLEAIEGSAENVKARKNYSLIYCPVAPLTHDGEMLDAYLELGSLEMPVMIMPMPVNGTTGPASLYSNIALANAEVLSSILVFQMAHPGRPLIYSSATGTLDFRAGGYLAGNPEMGLQSAAMTTMGRFYHLPSTSAGCTSDAKQPGPEAVIEKIITTLPSLMVGSDIIIGMGEIESDQNLILEQLVVDNEIAHLCERLVEGVDAAPERDLFSDIAQVGPGGNYLKARSTRQASRSTEFYLPKLIDRHPYEAWVSLGKPSMYSAARQKVQEIIQSPQVDPLPEGVLGRLEDILRRAAQDIPEFQS
jgi:trimethylamine--corrinoid protein Co-methyltransferase